jgi:hypothetical protein
MAPSLRTASFLPVLLALAAALPAQEEARQAVVVRDGAKLHAFYDPRTAVVLEAAKDLPVEVVGEYVPWSRVRVPGGLDVWIHGDYADFAADGTGKVTRGNVNIRPKPSTGSDSPPLGHFPREAVLTRLAVDGDWVQVRLDGVSAWVETRHLDFPEVEVAAWKVRWREAAAARAPVALVDEIEEVPMEEVVLTEEDETVGGGEELGPDEKVASAEELPLAVEAAARPVFRIDETTIATDPAAARERAGEELEVFATLVTRSDANWDRARADALEDILGRVLWHAADVELLDLARADMAKLDGLRRFYLSSLQGRERADRASGRTAVAEVLAAQLAGERRPNRGDGETSVVVVGWLTREVLPGGQGSLRLQRGKSVFPLEDRDGLHDLPSLRGREIVVRGTWAERPRQVAADAGLAGLEGEEGGLLVLTVRELRVLPARAE